LDGKGVFTARRNLRKLQANRWTDEREAGEPGRFGETANIVIARN
jgi:hypothetical protein